MKSTDRPLASIYDVALLDLDGVVYLGEEPIQGVPEALLRARELGMRLAFVTNNASRTPQQVASLLQKLGIPADVGEVVTSSHAAAHYLADRLPPGAPVLVLGTAALEEAIAERGLKPVRSADDSPEAVVQGYSPGLDWHALAEGMVAICDGATWVATNLDPTVPSPRGPLPGNGSLVAALAHATRKQPIATGKPDPTMHAESVQRSQAANPIVVGDRLDTDIEGARRAECASLLVFTGVTHAADLLTADTDHRPDYLGVDVSALLSAHPQVRSSQAGFHCGTASAMIEHDSITLSLLSAGGTESDGLDALRGLACACWSVIDSGRRPASIIAADGRAAAELDRLGLSNVRSDRPGTVDK